MSDPALLEALGASQRLGMLGGRPIAEVIEHAGAFTAALIGVTGTVIDLGSGGGVPGLVIARARPDLRLTLVDRRASRTDHLARLVRRLALADRVAVVTAEAADLPTEPPADAVVARGFGPPATTLCTAARLVRAGGLIVVSEPPESAADRWAAALGAVDNVTLSASPDRRVACFRVSRGT